MPIACRSASSRTERQNQLAPELTPAIVSRSFASPSISNGPVVCLRRVVFPQGAPSSGASFDVSRRCALPGSVMLRLRRRLGRPRVAVDAARIAVLRPGPLLVCDPARNRYCPGRRAARLLRPAKESCGLNLADSAEVASTALAGGPLEDATGSPKRRSGREADLNEAARAADAARDTIWQGNCDLADLRLRNNIAPIRNTIPIQYPINNCPAKKRLPSSRCIESAPCSGVSHSFTRIQTARFRYSTKTYHSQCVLSAAFRSGVVGAKGISRKESGGGYCW